MGLRDLKAKAIETAATWYVTDWLRRAEAGEKGVGMQKAYLWLMANKVPLAGLCNVLSGLFAFLLTNELVHGQGWKIAVGVLFYFGGVLLGAGGAKSDGYYKPQFEALKDVQATDQIDHRG